MHRLLADKMVESIRKRVSEGDCPTEPPQSVENLEDLVLTLAALLPAPAAREPETGVSGEVVHLTFDDLRRANIARQEHWGGSENWTLADWSNAVAGEVGEACNIVKKIRRPQLRTIGNGSDVAAYYSQLESEIGDVLIYLDLLAKAAGLGLAGCVMRAFNDKSAKLDMPVRLAPALAASHHAHPGREEALEEAATLVEECARQQTGCSIDYASEQLAGAIRSLKSPPHSTPPTSSKGGK